MKKLALTSLASCMFILIGYSSNLKGSDYISTNVGTTYNYNYQGSSPDENLIIETTVKSCNKEKNSCTYTSQMKESNGKEVSGSKYQYKYNIENNAVYTIYPGSNQKELLFPAKIEFNKIRKDNGSSANGSYTNAYEFTKQIPKLNINGKNYKNCIELEADSDMQIKKHNIKTKSLETYCKGIGLVKENLKTIHNSDKPIIYKNVLASITD